eukprot:m.74725 g.74725  ORF g.74725 m.74725 type:complete len:82 (-) comp24694_c0_seq1:657-902(-)
MSVADKSSSSQTNSCSLHEQTRKNFTKEQNVRGAVSAMTSECVSWHLILFVGDDPLTSPGKIPMLKSHFTVKIVDNIIGMI